MPSSYLSTHQAEKFGQSERHHSIPLKPAKLGFGGAPQFTRHKNCNCVLVFGHLTRYVHVFSTHIGTVRSRRAGRLRASAGRHAAHSGRQNPEVRFCPRAVPPQSTINAANLGVRIQLWADSPNPPSQNSQTKKPRLFPSELHLQRCVEWGFGMAPPHSRCGPHPKNTKTCRLAFIHP